MPLAHLANLINPVLAVLLLTAPWAVYRRRQRVLPWGFWGQAALALGVVYVVAHVNRWLHLWPAHPLFPSGHIAFAVCAATSLALLDRRWLFFLVPLIAVQAVLIVMLHYHVWADIGGAVLLAPPVTWLCHALPTKRAAAVSG